MHYDCSVYDMLDELSDEDIDSGITVQREVMLDPYRVLHTREASVPSCLTAAGI